MTTVLGTFIPKQVLTPNLEICHTFVYRWLVARGRITGNYPNPLNQMMQVQAQQILFPIKGQPARAGGVIQVTAGTIVGFWDFGGNLQHSMIAETPTTWIGTNNTGCFAVGGGRISIPNVDQIVQGNNSPVGWVGAGNVWQGLYAQFRVTYKLPPIKRF